MLVHATDEKERERSFHADDVILCNETVMMENAVSAMPERIMLESNTAELVTFITDEQIRYVSVQLLNVSVQEFTVISVQFSRVSTTLLEVSVDVFISRVPLLTLR